MEKEENKTKRNKEKHAIILFRSGTNDFEAGGGGVESSVYWGVNDHYKQCFEYESEQQLKSPSFHSSERF